LCTSTVLWKPGSTIGRRSVRRTRGNDSDQVEMCSQQLSILR
jgi:hypothetical protein